MGTLLEKSLELLPGFRGKRWTMIVCTKTSRLLKVENLEHDSLWGRSQDLIGRPDRAHHKTAGSGESFSRESFQFSKNFHPLDFSGAIINHKDLADSVWVVSSGHGGRI